MREAFWYLIALDGKIFISTVSNDFEHARLELLDDFKSLLSIVNCSDSPLNELFLNGGLILLVIDMRKLNCIQRVMLLRNPIPDKSVAIFTHSFDFVHNLLQVLLSIFCLRLAVV